ncbi:PIN domain-containing protein [Caryophanon latum]|uniref:PIN domain-containing protein n=1 Tax=Caryophanon latum TaxID=33977 RepID=A0A1C0YZM5_9BACL|nr:PIN domain-containing protein [Caryophanon latum]OCS92668.1 hypothetical protein A6K76_06210 [Caryophanon latum]
MNKRLGKVFVDTNILLQADWYQHDSIFEWIDALYEEVYIHQMVLDELLSVSARNKVTQYIDDGRWHLFNPDDENCLSDDLYDIYEGYVHQMKQAFRQLDQKKMEQGRRLKGTNDLGEIHCLAAALLISAAIICSNDGDIQEVIDDNELEVASEDETENRKLVQDTLKDFCYYICLHKIAPESKVRKLLKAFQKEKIQELDALLNTIR